jgi:hypothetical protein
VPDIARAKEIFENLEVKDNMFSLFYNDLLMLSSVANPMPTLKTAMKFVTIQPKHKWGMIGNKIKLPNKESLIDSYFWYSLRYVCQVEGFEIIEDFDHSTLPGLSNDNLTKGLKFLIDRIRMVSKTPNGVTLDQIMKKSLSAR